MQYMPANPKRSLELETAWALNFDALGIIEEEEDILKPESDEKTYVEVWVLSCGSV